MRIIFPFYACADVCSWSVWPVCDPGVTLGLVSSERLIGLGGSSEAADTLRERCFTEGLLCIAGASL